jgi:carbon-monoxide dehydrogenase large subunit
MRAAAPVGASLRRREDPRLVTGAGRFLDDLRLPGMLHTAMVRSPHAHARLRRIESAPALARPGVVAVLTAAELPEADAEVPPLAPTPDFRPYRHPLMARAVARHAGEIAAVVVAATAYQAADAAEAVRAEWEPLPAAASVEAALAPGAPRVFEDWPDNLAGLTAGGLGDPAAGLRGAAVVVEEELAFPRVAGSPIEPRGVLACPAGPGSPLTVWSSTQVPFAVRAAVARALGLAEADVRVVCPEVGGGFGVKGHAYAEELLLPAVARRLGRPVKWVETRSEHLLTAAPDRDQRHRARLALDAEGRIAAIETEFTRDHGAYPTLGDVISRNTINHLVGPYRVPHYRARGRNVVTHKSFAAAYRGAGRPEAAFVVERLLDRAARRLGLDPAEVRRRNLVRPAEMPWSTGLTYRDGVPIRYDPADYPGAFERVLDRLDYAGWRQEQARRRRQGLRPIGIGLATYTEGTGIGPFEGALVRIDPDGSVLVDVGVGSQGQAHETTLAQLAAAALGVAPEAVRVRGGDTQLVGFGMGTIASRVAAVAGPAVARSAREVADKARRVAAELLECAPADVVLADGHAAVAGLPARRVSLGRLAAAAVRSRAMAADGQPGLHACAFFYPDTVTWAFGAHACVVEVDPDTGAVALLRYAAVHDCGRPVNPMVVEGQLHGGLAQGIGSALGEELVHDEAGQLLTGSLMDYPLPRADLLPSFDVEALDHPSMMNELGIKGVGESGVIAPTAAIANAVEDALDGTGAALLRLPLSPARVWAAWRAAAAPAGPR